MQHQPLSFFQSLLQICAMKKPGVQPAGGVLRGHVKHWGAASDESNRVAASNLCKHRMNLPGYNFRNRGEMYAVFVAKWQITQQVGDRSDSAFLQNSGSLRTNSSQIFHRIGKCYSHRMVTRGND